MIEVLGDRVIYRSGDEVLSFGEIVFFCLGDIFVMVGRGRVKLRIEDVVILVCDGMVRICVGGKIYIIESREVCNFVLRKVKEIVEE